MATPTTMPTPEQLQAILDGPAGTPPAGVMPNFDDPPNLDTVVAVALTLCVTFATSAVFTRMYTKRFLIRAWAYEDCETLAPFPLKSIAPLIDDRRSCNRMGKHQLYEVVALFTKRSRLAKSHRAFHPHSLFDMAREYIYGMYR